MEAEADAELLARFVSQDCRTEWRARSRNAFGNLNFVKSFLLRRELSRAYCEEIQTRGGQKLSSVGFELLMQNVNRSKGSICLITDMQV